jgi:hypothetical protein
MPPLSMSALTGNPDIANALSLCPLMTLGGHEKVLDPQLLVSSTDREGLPGFSQEPPRYSGLAVLGPHCAAPPANGNENGFAGRHRFEIRSLVVGSYLGSKRTEKS